MSEERATLEMIAPTVEEAIDKGLSELGLSREDVDIEVLDEGGRALLGIRNRQARVRLAVKRQPAAEAPPAQQPSQPRPGEALRDEDLENTIAIARATVVELLDRMKVRAEVDAGLGQADESGQKPPVVVNIHGNDLSILIGRRAETLNALQFITRLIVGKELGRAAHIVVDVEGYRQRRERSLRRLARRMAKQALNTGRRQTLEPMTPAERRIIHLELRDDPNVTTESIGEDPRRKVTINPVR